MDIDDQTIQFPHTAIPPVSSQTQFANWVGVSDDTVRGWVENRTLPTVKIGRQRFICLKTYLQEVEAGKTIFNSGDYK
ncbi:helix-turn-helix domain-containing protein [Saccharophagus degradans]|uniref:helix-turn-helix domain-containing protein n=1 Tax=Saccharophagus degradans TaxID=86304 RepID=UPI0024781D77|nr:helix-turn-helix domain-containing protein [Saccharophagus degradans]WGO98441.1 helix-turn-helix domain-containing protein [Saccharophagus degradans]